MRLKDSVQNTVSVKLSHERELFPRVQSRYKVNLILALKIPCNCSAIAAPGLSEIRIFGKFKLKTVGLARLGLLPDSIALGDSRRIYILIVQF